MSGDMRDYASGWVCKPVKRRDVRQPKSGEPPVSYDEAVRRVRAYLALPRKHRVSLSILAGAIWPHHRWNAQGAALAASRMVDRMERHGVIRRDYFHDEFGGFLLGSNREAGRG